MTSVYHSRHRSGDVSSEHARRTATEIFVTAGQSGVFGLMISLIAFCFLGLRVSGGAEGVGRATTVQVVRASFR
jgi:ABC-type transporter Mla maintaining outer membrane lipid asymmetry permease subunit MlaE